MKTPIYLSLGNSYQDFAILSLFKKILLKYVKPNSDYEALRLRINNKHIFIRKILIGHL